MKTGTVKFFNEAKGFGFIKMEDGKDIFVHANDLQDRIREGDTVTFDVAESSKGLNATGVKKA